VQGRLRHIGPQGCPWTPPSTRHILAITQLSGLQGQFGVSGPGCGRDTHALSGPAFETALEVCPPRRHRDGGRAARFTPTPVITRAEIEYNRGRPLIRRTHLITPTHNPPEDGVQINPPEGGPAERAPRLDRARANEILAQRCARRGSSPSSARLNASTVRYDYAGPYVRARHRAGPERVAASGLTPARRPGARRRVWRAYRRYGLSIEVLHVEPDPAFLHDPHPRRQSAWTARRLTPWPPSSRCGPLLLAFGNDPDFDRHGIVTRGASDEPEPLPSASVAYSLTRTGGRRIRRSANPSEHSMIRQGLRASRQAPLRDAVGFKWYVPLSWTRGGPLP
jgi:phosphoglucomutase